MARFAAMRELTRRGDSTVQYGLSYCDRDRLARDRIMTISRQLRFLELDHTRKLQSWTVKVVND